MTEDQELYGGETGGGKATAEWAAKQIWPSLESITMKCQRPLSGSGGFHWWYNDPGPEPTEYVPIVCKSCGLKLKLSIEAPEYPSI